MKMKRWRMMVHVSWVLEGPVLGFAEASRPATRSLLVLALPTVPGVCSADPWAVE